MTVRALQRISGLRQSQRGLAMYIIIFLIGAAGLAMVAAYTSSSSIETRRITEQARILAATKQAILGYAAQYPATNSGTARPGTLPAPDTLADSHYYGAKDTGCANASQASGLPLITTGENVRCFGRLPWQDLGLSLTNASEQDVDGIMPWYAVSANLTAIDSCLNILNSNIASRTYSSYVCNSSTNLPYPWLTVRDSRGNVVSDRVAVVILLPGSLHGSQQRPGPDDGGLRGATEYLDSVTVASGCSAPCVPGSYSNADFDNDFIAGESGSSFNDRLVYITIDELMPYVEKRVAAELKALIADFAASTSTGLTPSSNYFWLSTFDPTATTSSSLTAPVGTLRGSLPYMGPPDGFGSTFATAFQWSLSGGSVSPSGTVTAAEIRDYSVSQSEGACIWTRFWSTQPLRNVECSATVNNPKTGVSYRSIRIQYRGSSTTKVYSSNPAAANLVISPATATAHASRSVRRSSSTSITFSITDYDASGNVVGTGSRSGNSIRTWGIALYPETYLAYGPYVGTRTLPSWYLNNDWHKLAYIALAPGYAPGGARSCAAANSCLSIRKDSSIEVSNLEGVILMPGVPLSSQTRPSAALSNYFDNATNQNGATLIFDRAAAVSSSFNDQPIKIAP